MSVYIPLSPKKIYVCHGRKSNLVEFQILPVESPIGVSTGRKSNWNLPDILVINTLIFIFTQYFIIKIEKVFYTKSVCE